ncbi:MAG: oligosaccharide flippase family protein, partial [Pyrinomonadaceae bacterium]
MTDAIRVDKRARLARNSLLGLLAWVFPAIPSLIVTPIVVHRLGSADYGLYIAIIGITGFFFTSGVGRIAAKYVAEYRATDDDQRASEMLSATLVVTLVPTVIGLIFLAVTAPFVVNRVLLIATSQELTATEGLWIAGAVIIVTALTQVWQSALQGLHR